MICPLCLSKENIDAFTANNFHGHHKLSSQKIIFKKCLSCGCLFPLVKVNAAYFQKYYPQNYHHQISFLEKIWINHNLKNKIKLVPKTGTLLDVGCGEGAFVKSLPDSVKAYGIDLNPSEFNQNLLIKDDFLKHNFSQKFDTITFWHSLEHFSDPHQAIRKSLSLLKKHGQILISIPNTNSLAYKIGQNSWFHLDSPRHLFLPNEQNIQKIFPKNCHIKIFYYPFEFPLDLYWSLKNKKILRLLYPFLKLFDHETMHLCIQKI